MLFFSITIDNPAGKTIIQTENPAMVNEVMQVEAKTRSHGNQQRRRLLISLW